MPVVSDYTALLGGDYWGGIETTGKPAIVTYSFAATAPAYLASIGGFNAGTAASFQPFTAAMQVQARAALDEWSAASGIVFIEVAPGKGDISFQQVDLGTTAYAGAGGVAFYPFGDWNYFTYPSFRSDLDASGDVFMNGPFSQNGEVNYGTLLHEIGHALGLKHPTETVTNYAGPSPVVHDQMLSSDDPTRTIMATVGDPNQVGTPHLHQLDKDAIAYIYGAAGTGGRYAGDASGTMAGVPWSWNAAAETLTQTGNASANTIRGASLIDIISGGDGDDQLFGLNGNDVLTGGIGNDVLDGGPGNDSMTGGAGDDSYLVDSAGDQIIEADGEGFDYIRAFVSYTIPDNVEGLAIYGVGLTATGNDFANTLYTGNSGTLRGLGGNDNLSGSTQNDTLDGGTGADFMFGGKGDDRYYVDDAGDRIIEYVNEGTDSVYSTVRFSLAGQHIEKLYLQGTANIDAIGNGLVNTLVGNSGNNILNGYGGADIMTGGAGDDTYYVDNPGDVINELPGEGIDRVFATSSYSLSGRQVEKLNLLGTGNFDATGNSFDNSLVGNSGDNVLNGMTGADLMNGGAGNDTYYVDNVGDQVVELAGGGIDTVLSTIDFSLAGLQAENLTLRGTAINGMGNSLANLLIGNNSANVLNGLTGDDELHGGKGADTLTGGAGLDKFVFDTVLGGGEIDTITDFIAVDDQIGLARSIFTALAPGDAVSADAFRLGTAALDADDRIVYNQATGALYYDADGNGAGAMVQFARLGAGTAVTAADLYIL